MKTLQRILVVHPYGVGDLLFVTPVLRALRTVPTVECVDLLLGSRTKPMIENNPHVDDIFVVDKDYLQNLKRADFIKELWYLGKVLRRKKYDCMLDFSGQSTYGFLGRFVLGIPRLAGFDYKHRGFWHTHRFKIPDGFSNQHVADFFCGLSELAGIPVPHRQMEVYLSDETKETAVKISEKTGLKDKSYVTISLGGGESWGKQAYFKRWSPAYFSELLGLMAEDIHFKNIVILGSGAERELGETLEKDYPGKTVNLCGRTSMEEAAAVIRNSLCFVGNDGGLLHIAHAVRTPVLGIYGPVNPVEYGPYPETKTAVAVFKKELPCRPCYKKFRFNSSCRTRECLTDLTPKEVYRQALEARWMEQFKITGEGV